jgi:hypothetical protein
MNADGLDSVQQCMTADYSSNGNLSEATDRNYSYDVLPWSIPYIVIR